MTKEYCPECKELVEFKYDSTEASCEDCGSHLATECPKCGKIFDSVWGYEKIENYQKEWESYNENKKRL